MNIKLNNKLTKIAVAALALITTSTTAAPTTITNLTTVSAKAKKHHKKVKKTKKSKKKAYVIAKYYDEFKLGYSYTYNKKKGVFIGHKTKKRHSSTTDSDKPKVEQATSTYNVPKVKEFNDKIQKKYYLDGYRWAKTTIAVNINDLTTNQQTLATNAINQINELNIVTLVKTNKKANITIKIGNSNAELGNTDVEEYDDYKNLQLLEKANVSIYDTAIEQYSYNNYNLLFQETIIHELGHALGLKHNEQSKQEIMAPTTNGKLVKTSDGITPDIDQDYINSLAILYQN